MLNHSDDHNKGQIPAKTDVIVIGGSIAGLTAAQVLSKHFDRVTILERDTFPEGIGSRKGVPQGRHIHVLLARGKEELEGLFPGLQDELGRGGRALARCRHRPGLASARGVEAIDAIAH